MVCVCVAVCVCVCVRARMSWCVCVCRAQLLNRRTTGLVQPGSRCTLALHGRITCDPDPTSST
eukprot:2577450-Rhodomonas_salina.3